MTLHCMQSLAMRVLRRAGTLRAAGVRFVTDTWERGAEQDVAKWEEEREEVVEKVRAYNRSRVTLRLRSPLSSYALAATGCVHTHTPFSAQSCVLLLQHVVCTLAHAHTLVVLRAHSARPL